MHEWLSSHFSALCSYLTMDCYELTFTVPSPANSVAFMEFSPNGRFIAIGDRDLRSLYILDRLAGLHPIISAATPTEPTALVWRNSKELYVGLNDGRFIHYRMDLRGNRLVKGATNNTFYGGLPATAIALDAESRTLILSVGPEVFAFRRIWATSTFYLLTNRGSKLTLLKPNSASLAIFQAASTSSEIPEIHPLSRGLSVLPPPARLSSHFVTKT